MKIWQRIRGRCQRDLSKALARRPLVLSLSRPMISFTFDDFPRSALLQGGIILRNHDVTGTYYASFGLMGKIAPTGQIFSVVDLEEFIRQNHELGCHTFDHSHAWDTRPSEFEASVLRNRSAVQQLLPGREMRTLSYPISGPRPETKRRTAKYYLGSRGGGQICNSGVIDLNFLNAFFIEKSGGNFELIRAVVEDNIRKCGWLIFATHDVCDAPTEFGCTPAFFQKVVQCARESGAQILPVNEALLRIAHSEENPV